MERGPRHWLWRVAGFTATYLIVTIALAYAIPLPERLTETGSRVVEYADGTPAYVFLSPDERWRIPADRSRIDPAYINALLRLEDKRFYRHFGVDYIALARAAWLDVTRRHIVSGGSTLTMQLVRMVEPRPRSFRSKAVEILRAMQLEIRMTKPQILDAYLTFTPYGKNLEGVEAASLRYFGHSAASLSPTEIATLLAVPQEPTHRVPSAANADRLKAARDLIAQRLLEEKALPQGHGTNRVCAETVLSEVAASPVPTSLHEMPRDAPHVATWLAQKADAGHDARPIHTTLDWGTQNVVERTLTAAQPALKQRGIHNAVAIVVDHATGDVRGMVGNLDFWDKAHGGQIPGFDIPRSTGSALKPFIYALAIDQGEALPQNLVTDIPMQFGTYAPHNYDGSYTGLVRLEDALTWSLNVPFVQLLSQVGVERFAGALREMGVETLNDDPGYYGLSAAVGGMELTPLEMAALYATLAENGRYRPIRLVADASSPYSDPLSLPAVRKPPRPEGERGLGGEGPGSGARTTKHHRRPRTTPSHAATGSPVFTPAAAYLTKQALSRRDRPDFPARAEAIGLASGIHWKTGTSFGHRDAWAIGSDATNTVVVWLGNFDRSPSVQLVGAPAAGPVLFDLLEALSKRSTPQPPPRAPDDLTEVEVCAYSGHLATPACPHTKHVFAPRDSVPTSHCPYHVAIDVDTQTGLALTPTCRSGHTYTTETFVVWPASIRRWLADDQRRVPRPPAYAPGCEVGGHSVPPTILSPPSGQIAMLIPGVSASKQQIPLEAESREPNARLSWFVDGDFLGTYAAEERVWWQPEKGRHTILVVDDRGESSRRTLQVRAHP